MGDDAYAAFECDVPEHIRENAMYAMAVATGEWEKPDNVQILEHDRIDAINCRASGVIEIEGTQYTFQMEDGNWNGTVLLAWESDKAFRRHQPTIWALQPKQNLIFEAIANGNGSFLLMKWDAVLKNKSDIADIPRKYMYDKYVQPGVKIETHWRDLAAKHHFEIVTEDEAQETRRRLKEATK